MGCLGDDTIAAYVDGALDEAAVSRVDEHVDSCTSCRAQLSAMAASPVMHSFVLESATTVAKARVSAVLATARLGDELEGVSIGRYVVDSVIGRGGMGVVVRARDPELDRSIAIKLVAHGDGAPTGSWRSRLRSEARAMAKLRHPNVVAVYDAGVVGEQVFVAMELVEGESFARRLEHDRSGVLELCIAAGNGICAAHAAGLVHGDIKPDNILVDRDGRALIGDFGLSRAISERANTLDGFAIAGTPVYMAPEMLRGDRANISTDQYAFAITVYEAYAGKRPWEAPTLSALLEKMELLKPICPETMPPAVWDVVVRGLATDPAQRYPSMAELVADLERARREERAIPAQRARGPSFFAVVAAGTAVLAISGVLALRSRDRTTAAAPASASRDAGASITTVASDAGAATATRATAPVAPPPPVAEPVVKPPPPHSAQKQPASRTLRPAPPAAAARAPAAPAPAVQPDVNGLRDPFKQ